MTATMMTIAAMITPIRMALVQFLGFHREPVGADFSYDGDGRPYESVCVAAPPLFLNSIVDKIEWKGVDRDGQQ